MQSLEHMHIARIDATISYLNELLGWELASLKMYDRAIGHLGPAVNSACTINRNCHLCNMAQVRDLISARGGVPVGDDCRIVIMSTLLERGAAVVGPMEVVTLLAAHEKRVLACYRKHRKMSDIDKMIRRTLGSEIEPVQVACWERIKNCRSPLI